MTTKGSLCCLLVVAAPFLIVCLLTKALEPKDDDRKFRLYTKWYDVVIVVVVLALFGYVIWSTMANMQK